MGKLENELDALVHFRENGGGFGDPDALEEHQQKIDLLKFKITRRDNIRIAVVSALIGAVVAAVVTILTSNIG